MDNDYRIPELQGLETKHYRNFNPEANSSVHNSHMYVITIDDIKVYKKHKEIIKTLYLESIEIITKRKIKFLNYKFMHSKTLFKGEEINDAEESKKIGLRYLSKHNLIHTKKLTNERRNNGII